MPTRHIVTAYDEQLNVMHNLVREMGRLAAEQIGNAVAAIADRDTDLAAQVMERDGRIDALEQQVEGQVVRLLALRHPKANDLRVVIAGLRIANNLERIGDFAANVAKRSMTLHSQPEVALARSMLPIGQAVAGMLGDVMRAYDTNDADAALAVRRKDADVDRAYTALFRELLTYMMESPARITACTHLLFAAKNLERIGDHATNIAETLCFRVSGQPLDEERAKGDDTATMTVMPD
ncbi:phosphate transport system regulatory protein PhoU [Niveispirillum lacus]|uniref:Phosphate-specific transport system accessory protein PhoU n=1 Tax=Niveispirillum lacus TaxID=1981099 RepID=A0A255Z540_9PROT|nr:phosphate transport system regulatory protein PhoU [Niveispirillum lacus]